LVQKREKRLFTFIFTYFEVPRSMSTTRIEIKTERLRLVPLSYNQLKLYLRTDYKLEENLGVKPVPRYLPEDLEEVLEEVILPAVLKTEPNHLFFTLWTLIDEEENVLIGDLCFKGKVNKMGEVEIGYGTHEPFQNRGYMTEAIRGIMDWLKNYPMVRVITAETKWENEASIRTLQKLGFRRLKESEKTCFWYIDLP
jgi:ribosomal-protein-alanine N-acetyltransferase